MNIIDKIMQLVLVLGFTAALFVIKNTSFWVYIALIIGILAGVFYKKFADAVKWFVAHFIIKIKDGKVELEEESRQDDIIN